MRVWSDPVVEYAIDTWKFNCWLSGLGSDDEIEWAARWWLLRPLHHPCWLRKVIAMKAIEMRRKRRSAK